MSRPIVFGERYRRGYVTVSISPIAIFSTTDPEFVRNGVASRRVVKLTIVVYRAAWYAPRLSDEINLSTIYNTRPERYANTFTNEIRKRYNIRKKQLLPADTIVYVRREWGGYDGPNALSNIGRRNLLRSNEKSL